MSFVDRLDRKIGKYAPANLTLYLIVGQVLVFVSYLSQQIDLFDLLLVPGRVLQGEWWRLITFLFVPPSLSPIFILFAWYLFYLMGTALEAHWGAFRYTLFILAGFVLTVTFSFLQPGYPATNVFIGGSVFLAFAFLYPDFIINIFFVLPIRIKWLALITWLGYGFQFIMGTWQTRLMVLASVGNFLLFFAGDLYWLLKQGGRRAVRHAQGTRDEGPYHRCTVCGITDKTHPDMDFRYCPECQGQRGYCRDHIFDHKHVGKKQGD